MTSDYAKKLALLALLLPCTLLAATEQAWRPLVSTMPWCTALTEGSLNAFASIENFRGIPDSGWEDNNGFNIGAEGAMPLPFIEQWDGAVQGGGSFGLYNLAGRGSFYKASRQVLQQGFATLGIFKKISYQSPWAIGLAYDLMLTKNFSVYHKSPTLSQWRAQCSFLFGHADEVGFRCSLRGNHFTKTVPYGDVARYRVSFQAVSQATCYWRHIFQANVETVVWAGAPFSRRLDQRNSAHAGKYIIGGELSVPFWDDWMLKARAQYVQPSTKRGATGSHEYGNNIAITVVYHFGASPDNRAYHTSWDPYLPLANNSNFLVDAAAKTTLHLR